MSLRRLSGWEPREVTEYEYDADGRLVRAVTVREQEWTPDEVAWLIAARADDADIGRYGERISEATDPKASPFYKGDGAIRYEVEGPIVNQAVREVEDRQDAYYKKWPDANRNGHGWRVRRRD